MARRVLWSLLGAVILFVWGFVGHVVLGIYDPAYQGFTDETIVIEVLERNAPAGGLYYVPLHPDRDGSPQAEAFVNFVPAGERSGFGAMIGRDLATNVLAVFIVVTLLGNLHGTGFGAGVARFALAGFLIGFVVHAYYWNWFDFPALYLVISILDSVVGWTLVGATITALARRQSG